MKHRHVRRSVLFVLLAAALTLTLGTASADEPLMTPAQPPASLDQNLEQVPLWLVGGGVSCYGGPGTGCSCSAICCYRCNGTQVWVPADVGSEFACKQRCQWDCGGGCQII